jgi:phosphopantetheine binding protein
VNNVQERLTRCFSAVFSQVSREEICFVGRGSIAEWDSVATITLFALIEEEFGIGLDVEELQNLDSFQEIYEYLCQKLR